jgi:hypothetical protein
MKMRKWFILCLLVVTINSFGEYLQGFEAEVAIYRNPALSPDESQVAFECRDWNPGMEGEYDSLRGSDIFLVGIKGSNLRQLTLYADSFWVSPDKSKVLLQTYYGLYLLDLAKRSTPRQIFNRFPDDILDGRNGSVEQISWSPSSKRFFFARAIGFNWDRKYSIIDAETLEEKALDNELKGLGAVIQWLGDSTIIFEKNYEIQYFNYFTKAWDYLATGMPDEPCTDPLLSPDKSMFLYRYKDQYKVRSMPIPDGKFHGLPEKKIICQVKDLPNWASNELTKSLWSGDKNFLRKIDYLQLQGYISQVKVSWSADSRKILIKGQRELWLYTISDSSYTPIFLDSIPIAEAILTPDQSKIFFISSFFGDRNGDGRITPDENFSDLKVYDLKNKECRFIINHSEPAAQLTLSVDGHQLAFVKGNNIWILSTEFEKPYQVTSDGGLNPRWLQDEKTILFTGNGSLVKANLDKWEFTYFTLGRGVEPNWINDKQIAVQSRGKFWQIFLDRAEVKELQKYPERTALIRGKKYEVYVEEIKLMPRHLDLTEVRVRDIQTLQSWVVKPAWKNF